MKLLLDANLSWRLVKPLEVHYEVAHVLDFFKHDEKDLTIWSFAKEGDYTIVTNDEDFINLLSSKGWPPKIVLLKTGNQTNDYLLTKLVGKKNDIEAFEGNTNLGLLIIV